MPPGPVSCIGGTKYPHCIVLYCKTGKGVVFLPSDPNALVDTRHAVNTFRQL